MVRAIFLIWTIYLSALSLMPCSDIYNNCEPSVKLIDNHQHQDDTDDLCSPFCSCSCCSVVVMLHEYPANFSERLFSENGNLLNSSIPFLESSFSGNIWQPPKI
ncbi:MAG: hypothetical protein MUC49_22280 [Raineya sp.]|nr:hypothetical protein [Raineya sp.]